MRKWETACFIKKRVTIAGYSLRPLSIKALIVLETMKHPFVCSKTKLELAHIISFLKICSAKNPFEPVKTGTWDAVLIVCFLLNPNFLFQVIDDITEYLTDHFSLPELMEPVKDGRGSFKKSDCPEMLKLVSLLMNKGHMNYEDALDMPFVQSQWLAAALMEVDGGEVYFIDTEKAIEEWKACNGN